MTASTHTQTRPVAIDSPLRAFMREFAQDKVSVVALTVLGLIVLLALIARLNADPRIAGYQVESENFESIHNHSAFAWLSGPQ